MKVKMKVSVSGPRNGQPWPRAGGVIDLPDREAAALCKQQMAEPVTDDRVEYATADQSDVEQRREDIEKVTEGRTDDGGYVDDMSRGKHGRGRGRPPKPRDADGNIIRD